MSNDQKIYLSLVRVYLLRCHDTPIYSYSCNNIACRHILVHATETQTIKSHAATYTFFLDITLFPSHSPKLPCHLFVLCVCSVSMSSINIHASSHPEIMAAVINFHKDIWGESTVGSRLSKLRLISVSEHLDVGSCRHVFGSSGKKTLRSLQFYYRRKQAAV